jgi:hypothetical protein
MTAFQEPSWSRKGFGISRPAWSRSPPSSCRIGAPRLRQLEIDVEAPLPSPEHRLYLRLQESDPDSAHSRYNALVRRLVGFERAAASLLSSK